MLAATLASKSNAQTLDPAVFEFAGAGFTAAAFQPDGKLILGGGFTKADGRLRNRLARLHPDGTLDHAFDPDFDGPVDAVTVQSDGKILVRGQFKRVNGRDRSRLARLHEDGSLDTDFNPEGAYLQTVQNDGVYVLPEGRILTRSQAYGPTGIVRLREYGSLDQVFQPITTYNYSIGSVIPQSDGGMLFSGSFPDVGGVSRQGLARLHPDGSLDLDFHPQYITWPPHSNPLPERILLDGEGRILSFRRVDNERRIVRHFLPDGSFDGEFPVSLGGFFSQEPECVTLTNRGHMLIGGYDLRADGGADRNLIRLNVDGSLDSAFNPSLNGIVNTALVLEDGRILLSGGFTTVNGQTRARIARFLPQVAATESLSVSGGTQVHWQRGGDGPVLARVFIECWEEDEWVFKGNAHRVPGGWRATGLSLPSGAWVRVVGYSDIGPSHSPLIRVLPVTAGGKPEVAVEQPPGSPLVSGSAKIDFGSRQWLATAEEKSFRIRNQGSAPLEGIKLRIVGAQAGDFTASPFGVTRLDPGEDATFTVGFSPRGGGPRGATLLIESNDVARTPFRVSLLGAGVQIESSFPSIVNGEVFAAVTQLDGKVVIGGNFTAVGPVLRNRIARFNPDGSLDLGFNPNASGPVRAIISQEDGKLILGGGFSSVAGSPRAWLLRLNPDGSFDPSFDPDSPNSSVRYLVQEADGSLLVRGGFTRVGSLTGVSLARLRPDGSVDPDFRPNLANSVSPIALQVDGKILVGSSVSEPGGLHRAHIARLNPDGTIDPSFEFTENRAVYSIAVQPDGKVLAGGFYTDSTDGSMARNFLVRLEPDGSVDESFGPGVNGHVDSLQLQADGKILLAGRFTHLFGTPRSRVARLESDGSLDPTFDPGVDDAVNTVFLMPDGRSLLGGVFQKAGGVNQRSFAVVPTNTPATQMLGVSETGDVVWSRGGGAPEVEAVRFDVWDGGEWTPLAAPERVIGGWRAEGADPPPGTWLRARGRAAGGHGGGSSGLVEWYGSTGSGANPFLEVTAPDGQPLADGSAVDFGPVLTFANSETVLVRIDNTGPAPLAGLELRIEGASAADFSFTQAPPAVIGPGGSATVGIVFSPSALGPRVATLRIESSATSWEPLEIELRGSGITSSKLTALAVANGALAPAFSPTLSSYAVSVGNAIAETSVSFAREHAAATVLVNGSEVIEGEASAPIPLSVGLNEITVLVTGDDGVGQNLYSIHVTRAPSSNAALAALSLQDASITPGFAPSVFSYASVVETVRDAIRVAPLPAEANATLAVRANGGGYQSVANGSASGDLPLGLGDNAIEVLVTAQDGVTQRVYTVAVYRMRQAQWISYSPLGSRMVLDRILLSATGGESGNGIVYSVVSGPGVIENGNELLLTGPGTVTLRVEQPGNETFEPAETVEETIEVLAPATDLAVGTAPTRLVGVGISPPAIQTVSLVSRKARRVTGYLSVANRVVLPERKATDRILLRGTRGNAFFRVRYLGADGNHTAAMLRGTYLTDALDGSDTDLILRAVTTPNKRRLLVRGTRVRYQRRSLSLRFRATSSLYPPSFDEASMRILTR